MKFIVDAQLPRRLARELVAAGHDVAHALELPLGNRTPDGDIAALAVREGRVVVTKDSDFVTTFLLLHSACATEDHSPTTIPAGGPSAYSGGLWRPFSRPAAWPRGAALRGLPARFFFPPVSFVCPFG
jgi:hypothetical protein